jgi:hypothetical protein
MSPCSNLAESPAIQNKIFNEYPEFRANIKELNSLISEVLSLTIHKQLPISFQSVKTLQIIGIKLNALLFADNFVPRLGFVEIS